MTANLTNFQGEPSDFENLISKRSGLIVAEFYADWCPSCMHLSRIYPLIAKEYPGVAFIQVNIDDSTHLTQAYGIGSIPHVSFIKGGTAPPKEYAHLVGPSRSQIKEKIDLCLAAEDGNEKRA